MVGEVEHGGCDGADPRRKRDLRALRISIQHLLHVAIQGLGVEGSMSSVACAKRGAQGKPQGGGGRRKEEKKNEKKSVRCLGADSGKAASNRLREGLSLPARVS